MRSTRGTDFPDKTPAALIVALDNGIQRRERLRVWYDAEIGRNGNVFDRCYVGRSCGNDNYPNGGHKVPLVILTKRSTGGGVLSVEHIIRVDRREGRRWLTVWRRA
jgi:hypothetical protein